MRGLGHRMLSRRTAILLCFSPLLAEGEKLDIPKGRELLDAAVLAAPGAKPEVAAVAMRRIGENYFTFSDTKAKQYLKTAFDLSMGIPPADNLGRERIQASIAGSLAPYSLKDAVAMLKSVEIGSGAYDPRTPAILKIVGLLTGKKQFDEAIELVNSLGATGQYPFAAARDIFEHLPKGDFRRAMVFGNAMTAYPARPALEFGEFLAGDWDQIPSRTAEAALRQVVDTVMAMKDDGLTESLGGAKGAVVLGSRQEVELFDLMHILLRLDPKKAEEILVRKPGLRAALAQYPEGRQQMGELVSRNRGYQSSAGEAVETTAYLQAVERIEKVLDTIHDNVTDAQVDQILELAKGIPSPAKRAELLANLAQLTADDQPEIARMVLKKSLALLDEGKDSNARLDALKEVARLAHGMHDDEAAWNAVQRMSDTALAEYKLDTDGDNPNTGLVDEWPATNAWRWTVTTAAEIFGGAAESVVVKISDADVALLVRIELAQKLLGRSHEDWMTSLRTPKK